MLEALPADILIKLAATVLIVVTATLVAERANSFGAAMIAALPISAGPAYLFIALDHGPAAVASSAVGGIGVNAVMGAFLYIAVILIPRFGIIIGLGVALAVWIAGALAILETSIGIAGAIALNIVAFPLFARLVAGRRSHALPKPPKMRLSDIALRAIAVVGVVFAVLKVGQAFGPDAAGLVALIPVVWISMALILYARMGKDACVAVLANGIIGMFGFCLALTVLHFITLNVGLSAGLILALITSIGWNGGLTLLRARKAAENRR